MSNASARLSTGSGLSKGAATVAAVAASSLMLVASMASAPEALGAFGDEFGVAPVNTPGSQAAPAYPGESSFWAGACDLFAAPPLGAAISGGVGSRPATILAPAYSSGLPGGPFEQAVVPAPSQAPHCIDHGAEAEYPGPNSALWSAAPSWRLPAAVQAGGHPDGTATFAVRRRSTPAGPSAEVGIVDGSVDNVIAELPAGFMGDPTATPRCSAEAFATVPKQCPPRTQVGVMHLNLKASIFGNLGNTDMQILPVYNLEPRRGNVAELGFGPVSDIAPVNARLVAKARTSGDFGVRTFIGQIPAALPLINQTITLWGVPWASSHDEFRTPQGLGRGSGPCTHQAGLPPLNTIPPSGLSSECQVPYEASWGPIRPFLSNLTECDPRSPVTGLVMDSYQRPGSFTTDGDPDLSDPDWATAESPAEPVTACGKLPFDPRASFVPTSGDADSASGLDVDIEIPQNDDPPAAVASDPDDATGAPAHWKSDAGLATSHLDRTVVPLPEGFTVNPSAAGGGLEGCTDAQIGVTRVGNPYLFDNSEPTCPNGSRIGTVEVTTPLLDEKLTGEFILGAPKSTDPASGEMFRVFLVVRHKERGLLAKVYGSAVADPGTGRLIATFDKNPRVPVEDIEVRLKGGARGLFAQSPTCGTKTTNAVFTPWTAAHGAGGLAKTVSDSFTVGGDCSGRFAPQLEAGMSTAQARGRGTFSFTFTRPQGEQWVAGLTAALPTGLLASVKGVPLCSDEQAAGGECPAGSRIGTVDAQAGSGDPFVLERKGDVYLTEGYRGGEYGLMVKVRAIAGPFRGAMELSPIVVRQAIHVDRSTARVTAVSDPLPTIHHGVPLRVREVTVSVDRPAFMLNPSDCEQKQVGAELVSTSGARAAAGSPFRASGCAALPFEPKLALRLTGRRQVRTGKHPGVRARVRQRGIGEAGIERAEVRLPKSLALDVNNAQALCEFEDGTKPDLENHCPKGSIVGRARAVSPLLNDPLVGNVYFVKNVRRDPKTGNEIRTLPMIIVALRGEVDVNLRGESDTTSSGKLVNTFANVPDAPISRFDLNIRGGKRGILAVTRTRRSLINLCARPTRHVAEADMDGQNGRRFDRDIRMRTPCASRKAQRAKQRKRRAAARRAALR